MNKLMRSSFLAMALSLTSLGVLAQGAKTCGVNLPAPLYQQCNNQCMASFPLTNGCLGYHGADYVPWYVMSGYYRSFTINCSLYTNSNCSGTPVVSLTTSISSDNQTGQVSVGSVKSPYRVLVSPKTQAANVSVNISYNPTATKKGGH